MLLNDANTLLLLGGHLEALDSGHDPVSYTHLDVYKRQVLEKTGEHALVYSLAVGDTVGLK